MWKDFFYFTQTERRGVILLLFIILLVALLPFFVEKESLSLQEKTHIDTADFEKQYHEFLSSLQKKAHTSKDTFSQMQTSRHYSKRIIQPIPFDPNTADSATFAQLGLPGWMIRNILHYREKQGVFRKAEDFQKIYGLKKDEFNILKPFIHINPSFQRPDTSHTLLVSTNHKDTLIKYEPGTVIELNKADTSELKKIPGIGSGIARRIVAYRQQLGGYYQIEQLKELHLKVEKLRPWFSIDPQHIRQLPVNRSGVERMMRHPYLTFYQAKVIYEHRKKYAHIRSLKELSLYEEFTSQDLDRLTPYLNLSH